MKSTFWWCLEHSKVEENFGCGSTTRIGPFDSAQDAAGALDRAKKREADQEARDRKDKED